MPEKRFRWSLRCVEKLTCTLNQLLASLRVAVSEVAAIGRNLAQSLGNAVL
jgi:hypothetical protein